MSTVLLPLPPTTRSLQQISSHRADRGMPDQCYIIVLTRRHRYVSYSVHGELISREAFLASNHAWYQPFAYNPFASSDARLAYDAPRFTKQDWLLFCSMALSANESPDRTQFSRIFSGVSLAHRACAAFSEAAHGKRFGTLPPCFEFTRASPANELYSLSIGIEKDYVQACMQYEEDRSLPPLHLMDLFRINMMVRWGAAHVICMHHVTRLTPPFAAARCV
jgi:hypothetical protein